MNKSDLKTGMVIATDDGMKFLVLLDTCLGNIFVAKDVWGNLDELNDDLANPFIKVVRIYKPIAEFNMVFNGWDKMKLIWQREPEIKELTLQEIADKFGVEASQLRIKESEATNGNSK